MSRSTVISIDAMGGDRGPAPILTGMAHALSGNRELHFIVHGDQNKLGEMLAAELELPTSYTWFPQRMGFIRNTLRARGADGEYKCDVVMGLPAGSVITALSLIAPKND